MKYCQKWRKYKVLHKHVKILHIMSNKIVKKNWKKITIYKSTVIKVCYLYGDFDVCLHGWIVITQSKVEHK